MLPHEFSQFLFAHGFLVEDDVNEIDHIACVHKVARENKDSFSATIELTEACNFRCLYCYQSHTPNHMNNGVHKNVISFLFRMMKKARHLHINWFGGEPLIRLTALNFMSRRLKKEAEDRGCSFTQFLTTNGYMITRSVAEQLSEIGIGNVQITLDGGQESHDRLRVLASGLGTYKRILDGCKNVIEAGMELLVRVNVNRWNVEHIENLLSDLESSGISSSSAVIHATRAVDHGNCDDMMSTAFFSNKEFAQAWIRILEVISSHGFSLPALGPIAYNCPFDLEQAVMIGCDGSIRHCSSSSEVMGYLPDDGDHNIYRNIYHHVKDRNPLADPICRDCLILPMCMGGCSYLEGIGEEKCIPEKYILPELVLLEAKRQTSNGGRR